MTDSTFWKGLALWFAGFAALALLGGAVLGVVFLGIGQAPPPPMDDLRVSNGDDQNHTVRIEIVPVNVSATGESPDTFTESIASLEPGESVAFEEATAAGEEYRLVVAVDDRDPESFAVTGTDDYCTTEIRVEANATVEVVTSCA
ncbi:hypothetical protein [Halorussus salinus]|uniref:hypothetical protein n=1 Tax=Halorussus salinus TaxID=1364935 RepID=UPI0010922ECC|nr:hypothetical protein [Halorussus salinus]